MKTTSLLLLSVAILAAPPVSAASKKEGLGTILKWNQIAIDASGYDHTVGVRQQMGPGRASRALAMVQIAVFDVVNAVTGGYESYDPIQPTRGPVSIDAAVAQAAHDVLADLFTVQAPIFSAALAQDLAKVKNKNALANGINLGKLSATMCMLGRIGDGSETPEPFLNSPVDPWITSPLPGHWRMDPISQIPIVLGGYWSEVAGFVVESSSQFRVPPFPSMSSPEYAASYNEVKRLGGDGVNTPTERTADQTIAGIYWAYDGVPALCAPPRLYNQIATLIADQKGSDAIETARLLALVNIAMADATLTCWESKYYYDIWRPVGGIREGDTDGNPATAQDATYSPLGAPASNLNGPNFTPPFPAYPSGHASMGGALFQTLRRFYGTDNIQFTFVSDELNGVTEDNTGTPRPLTPRTFTTLSQAEEENGQSRIYLGIHWSFDKTEGIAMGRKVADYVFDHTLRPLAPRR